jgi:hypothetical protein
MNLTPMNRNPDPYMKPNSSSMFVGRLVCGLLLAGLAAGSARGALTVTVVDDAGAPVNNFRWILQEDIADPGIPYWRTNDTVSMVVHKSDARVIATGQSEGGANTAPIRVPLAAVPRVAPAGTIIAGEAPLPAVAESDPDSTKPYVVQVMASGYSIGGQLVRAGQSNVKVVLNRNPLPTTQVSIFVYHDHRPLNNMPDFQEEGLAGFRIAVFDLAGGPYIQDAWANPLGTEYETNPDGTPRLDDEGVPVVKKQGDGYVYTDKDGKALLQNLWMHKFSILIMPPTGQNWNGGHASMKTGGYKWQTATIEGGTAIDAWTGANGARVFIEGWGAGFYHVFMGFSDPTALPGAAPPAGVQGVTLKGRLLCNHYGRPPLTAARSAGPPVKDGWVGLNVVDARVEGQAPVEGAERSLIPANTAVVAQACDPDTGEFVISNVAPGRYQVACWDRPLDYIFGFADVSVPLASDPRVVDGVYDMGDVLLVRWFGTIQGSVFYDENANGFRDETEETLPGVPLNLRFRDGSIRQSTQTGSDGTYAFTELFPFFKWMIAEVDGLRWKPTGLTAVVDDGGNIPPPDGWVMPSGDVNDPSIGVRNPQVQYEVNADGTANTNAPIINPVTGNALSRTQTEPDPSAPLLLQAVQSFLGQNDRIDWGKVNFGPGESGGIQGVVAYGNTRAESDPRLGVQDPWEPCVARVQIALYEFETNYAALAQANAAGKELVHGQPYDLNLWRIKRQPGHATPQLADVDNYPFGWLEGEAPRGPEDVDRDDPAHTLQPDTTPFNPGDAIQIVRTDSWDDDVSNQTDPAHPSAGGWPEGTVQIQPPVVAGRSIIGADNWSTWEQVRPGVFDGGYAVNSYYPGGMPVATPRPAPVDYLPAGEYIVHASPPPGYYIQTEESRNVVFGDAYVPQGLDTVADCVGDFHWVPQYLSLFPDQEVAADFANQWRPLADRKQARVIQGRNTQCSFDMYTEVPKAAHCVGFVLNDITAEFNPASPVYGEREGASWLPISFRDWAGHEVARTYSDEFGSYDAMVPSSFTAAVPCPSGFAPNMLTIVLNDPTMPDPANPDGPRIPDPYYNPGYTIAPVVREFYPGKVTYVDTPIVPIGAFVGSPNGNLDVEPPDQTPVIKSVEGTPVGGYAGPYVATKGPGGQLITITALGPTQVLDPEWRMQDPNYSPNTVVRNYGFGTGGTLTLAPTDRSAPGTAIPTASWNDATITFRLPDSLPAGTPTSTGGTEWQLMLTRADNGRSTPIGITLSYETDASRVHVVPPVDSASLAAGQLATGVQDALDAASNGDLIIVPAAPWTWDEYVVMWKPVRLQGSGHGTVLNGAPNPENRVTRWHDKIVATLGDDPFVINECPCVIAFGETNAFRFFPPGVNPGDSMFLTGFNETPSRVDGFTMKGAIHGGAINAFIECSNLRISNNRITGNMGDTLNGAIALGLPAGGGTEPGNEDPGSSTTFHNTNVVMEFNYIVKNSSLDGGGGIAVHTGGSAYKIRNNYIMGNFAYDAPGAATALAGSGFGGGGILHMGLSPGGLIADNVIAFNEIFFGFATGGGDGAGICIQGEADGGPAVGTSGSGSVTIINNLIVGNLAGAGLGGGIRLVGVNGPEMLDTNNLPVFENNPMWANPTLFPDDFIGFPSADPADWYEINIFNNIIANNFAGFAGGGISLQDALKVNIIGNTIVNNDSAAVAPNTFPNGGGVSVSQGGGIVSHPHSTAMSTNMYAPYAAPYSNPVLINNIIWQNRAYHFDYDLVGRVVNDPTNNVPIWDSGGLVYDGYVDLYVVGGGSFDQPDNTGNFLTPDGTPPFARPYTNSNMTALVYDEGGHNALFVKFMEIGLYLPDGTLRGDYHLTASFGPGQADVTSIAGLGIDYDGELRTAPVDIGADEYAGAGGFLPGDANATLPVALIGLLPSPNLAYYFRTPPRIPGEVPHFAEYEPVPENNPNLAPGAQMRPPPLNHVYMTGDPGEVAPLFVRGDFFSPEWFLARLQALGASPDEGEFRADMTLAAKADVVAKYVFDHLAGDWPALPPADGEEPPAPRYSTKGNLALWNGGWVKYNQPPRYALDTETMLAMVIGDMNAMPALTAGEQGNTVLSEGLRDNDRTAYAVLIGNPAYTPSTTSTRLYHALPPEPGAGLSPNAERVRAVQLLNRSVVQDGFTEIRRWYDPNIAYKQLIASDGLAVMGDGTELYTFGFSDQTEIANNPANDPNKGPDRAMLSAMIGANIAAPTIVLKQDQEFHLDLGNVGFTFRPDLFDPHTVHFHGFPNAVPIFDGMPMAAPAVLEGGVIPFYYNLVHEGTYFYHCHVEATEHMQMGMIGNLYVLARQNNTGYGANPEATKSRLGGNPDPTAPLGYAYNDGDGSTRYDVEYPIQMTGFDHNFHDQSMSINPLRFDQLFDNYPLLNGRGYPDTIKPEPLVNSVGIAAQQVSSLITAKQGQRVLLRLSNVSGSEFFTMTVTDIPMTVVGKDARLLRGPDGRNLSYRTASVTLGGGETADAILDTTQTPPGTYFLRTARLTHLSNDHEDYGGLMTHIEITP